MIILAADIGGTKTLLQLSRLNNKGEHTLLFEGRLISGDFSDLDGLIRRFLADFDWHEPVAAACLAVAGPVDVQETKQSARLTNLPWQLDSQALSQRLGIPCVRLINDFQAVGYAIEGLRPEQLHSLQERPPVARAPRLVVGAGTGLGVCLLVWAGDHYEVLPTEGGHISYAAQNSDQELLLHQLQARYGRVSVERVVSGGALPEVYGILHEQYGSGSLDAVDSTSTEASATIASRARTAADPSAVATIRLFSESYASVAADLALATLPRGGVFLAGGVTPKLLDFLQQPAFLNAFNNKGRMTPIVSGLPVHAVLEERCGLLGAALVASRLALTEC